MQNQNGFHACSVVTYKQMLIRNKSIDVTQMKKKSDMFSGDQSEALAICKEGS
uniref:Uncharacterized protein n=1 Tax=Setaria italica TaxID=4555 RepID=K3YZB8_SETIT